jgi:hypothetical protein
VTWPAIEAVEALIRRGWAARSGALPVPAFDQAETLPGAGPLGLELGRQAPEATTVLAGVGGGGLLSGIAAACAGRARIVGAEPAGAPTMTEAIKAGGPVDATTGSVAVDSLAPRQVGALTFAMISHHADWIVLVGDEAILRAQQLLWDRLRVVAEPGACAALAALLTGHNEARPRRAGGRSDQRREYDRGERRQLADLRLGRDAGSRGPGGPDFQLLKQDAGGSGHRFHGALEGLGVMPGGLPEAADLPDVLQGGRLHVRLGHVLGVGLSQGLDAAAHVPEPTPSAAVTAAAAAAGRSGGCRAGACRARRVPGQAGARPGGCRARRVPGQAGARPGRPRLRPRRSTARWKRSRPRAAAARSG